MMKTLLALVLAMHVVTVSCRCGGIRKTDGVEWKDELAQAACIGLQTQRAFTYAVRRNCKGGRSCADICESLSGKDPHAKRMWCTDAIHIAYGTHPCERAMSDYAVQQLGIKTYVDHQCNDTKCGPNFCCCAGMPY